MYSRIFHGRWSIIELQKCRNFRFSVNPLQNVFAFSDSFSSAYATDVSSRDCQKGQKFTVSYLVGSLGLSRKLAESISRRVSFEDKGNPDSVLSLLRSHGFTDSQISNIITDYPQLLILDSEKSVGPKLAFLQSREGVSRSELTEVLSKVPKIFGIKKEKAISVYYDFVKEVIEADKSSKFEKLCRSSLPLEGSKQGNKMRNVSLKKVVEMGFDPTTKKFVKALQAVYQMSDKTIEEKLDIYKKLGFTVEDVWESFKKYPNTLMYSEMKVTQKFESLKKCGLLKEEILVVFKRFPQCICLSAATVKKKGEFLVEKMNWPLKALVSNPQVFNLSMEKRIVPRCNVIKALMSKGLLGSEIPPMSSVLVCTDDAFLKRYVNKYNDMELVAELMAIFTRREREKTK